MTFIIRANTQPSDLTIPKLNLNSIDLKSILKKGSLVLLTPDDLRSGTNLGLNVGSVPVFNNSAKYLAASEYGLSASAVNPYIQNIDSESAQYFSLSQHNHGLLIECHTELLPTIAKILRFRFVGGDFRNAYYKSEDTEFYWDAWLIPIKKPITKENASGGWLRHTLFNDHSGFSPHSEPGIGLCRFDLSKQNNSLDIKPSKMDSAQLISTRQISEEYSLNVPKFLASAAKLNSINNPSSGYFSMLPTILEGGYSGFGFVLASVYIEDLTKSGRRADEVAIIRRGHFESYFKGG